MHEDAIMGGYIVMILMCKVPGSALSYDSFCRMSLSQRIEVREAFRRALTDVWACGVEPNDKGLRNIVWDQAERKCYIVDFEDGRIIDPGGKEPPEFHNEEYRYWNLDEDRVLKYRSWYGLDKRTTMEEECRE